MPIAFVRIGRLKRLSTRKTRVLKNTSLLIRISLPAIGILLLSACTGPAQTFGDFDSEPDVGAASEVPSTDNNIDENNVIEPVVDSESALGVPFADIQVVGNIHRVGFVELNGESSVHVKAEFYELTTPLTSETLTALEEELVLPTEKSCRYHSSDALSSRNDLKPANFQRALFNVATNGLSERTNYMTMVLAGDHIAFDSSSNDSVHVEQTRHWHPNVDTDYALSYRSIETSPVLTSADGTFTVPGSDRFPAFFSVPYFQIPAISEFETNTPVSDTDSVAGTILSWNTGNGSVPANMALAFGNNTGAHNSIVCSSEDTGTYTIPSVIGQVSQNWSNASVSLARHHLSAVQQGDALLIVRNTNLSYLNLR